METTAINTAFGRLLRRAEDEHPERLAGTFVDVGSLFSRLSTRNNQIVFGRRGTGKTHALAYLGEDLRAQGHAVVSVDLRLIGSTGGIYADSNISIAEAGTRLLIDVLEHVHENLVDQVLEAADSVNSTSAAALPTLDRLADAISEVSVIGEAEQRDRSQMAAGSSDGVGIGLSLSPVAPILQVAANANQARRVVAERELRMRGVARHRLHFGALGRALQKLVPCLPTKQLWLLLDEWSHVPLHLQPILADLLRHCVVPISGLTIKIAAIDHRSVFKIDRDDGSYVGFEIGADVAADIDLDDFMVFSNDHNEAVAFFSQMLYRHIAAMAEEDPALALHKSPKDVLRWAFASPDAFGELVRAGEGVPRDTINIVAKAALKAGDRRISISNVRDAARRWYLQDKEGSVKARPEGLALLYWIIDQVVDHRKARAFLLRQGDSAQVDWLYDQRVLHLVKRAIAAKDRPGVRFDVYKLDYGCYVDLLATRGGPKGLIQTDEEDYMEVPPDEYDDSIRGAILDLAAFEADRTAGKKRTSPSRPVEITVRSTDITFTAADSVIELSDCIEEPGWYLFTEINSRLAAIDVGRRALNIGSATGSQIRVRNGELLPKHALVSKADPNPVITSQGDATTYVNGGRIRRAELEDRDTIRLGSVEFVVIRKT